MIIVFCPHCGYENRISEDEEEPLCKECQNPLKDDDKSQKDNTDEYDDIPF